MSDVHDYLSTGCLHGEHEYCQSPKGQAGSKKPAQCKWCSAMCRCECHNEGLRDRVDALENWIVMKGYDLEEVEEEL